MVPTAKSFTSMRTFREGITRRERTRLENPRNVDISPYLASVSSNFPNNRVDEPGVTLLNNFGLRLLK